MCLVGTYGRNTVTAIRGTDVIFDIEHDHDLKRVSMHAKNAKQATDTIFCALHFSRVCVALRFFVCVRCICFVAYSLETDLQV